MDVLVQMLGDHATVDLRLTLDEFQRLATAGSRIRRERGESKDPDVPATEVAVRDCLARVLGARQ